MFSTGRGRAIEVSAEALARVQGLFKDDVQKDRKNAGTGGPRLKNDRLSGLQQSGGKDRKGGITSSFDAQGVGHVPAHADCTLAGSTSMFSTGSGRGVDVSADALAQAQNRFGADDNGDGNSSSATGNTARPPQASRAMVSPLPTAKQPFSLPRSASASGTRPGAGKENREQVPPPKRSTIIATPSSSSRRAGGSNTAFSPPGRLRGAMRPPIATNSVIAGISTPSPVGKSLLRRATPSSAADRIWAAAASTSSGGDGGSTTPRSIAKRRVLGGGYGGGLHGVKRSRSSSVSSASKPPSAASMPSPMQALTTPRGLRVGSRGRTSGRGAFPRPSPSLSAGGRSGAGSGVQQSMARGKGAIARSMSPSLVAPDDENSSVDCPASRMLFGASCSPEEGAAASSGASTPERKEEGCRRRHRGRRPLSSLLVAPSRGSGQLQQQQHPAGTGAGGDGGGNHNSRDRPLDESSEQPAEVAESDQNLRCGEVGGSGQQMQPPISTGIEDNELGTATAVVTTDENAAAQVEMTRRPSACTALSSLLGQVTAKNACDLLFGQDGRPLCFAPPASSFPSPAMTAQPPTMPGRSELCAPTLRGKEGERGLPTAAAPAVFHDELVRSGRDGQMATPTWVRNHARYV